MDVWLITVEGNKEFEWQIISHYPREGYLTKYRVFWITLKDRKHRERKVFLKIHTACSASKTARAKISAVKPWGGN